MMEMQLDNAVTAFRLGIISFAKYLEIVRELNSPRKD